MAVAVSSREKKKETTRRLGKGEGAGQGGGSQPRKDAIVDHLPARGTDSLGFPQVHGCVPARAVEVLWVLFSDEKEKIVEGRTVLTAGWWIHLRAPAADNVGTGM